MALTYRAARALDALEAFPRWTRRRFSQFARQVDLSVCATVREDDDQVVAIVGLYDLKDGWLECWFMPGPAGSRRLVGLMKLLRAWMGALAARTPGVGIVVYIEPGSVAGPRMAAMLGFADAGVTETDVGPFATWRRRL